MEGAEVRQRSHGAGQPVHVRRVRGAVAWAHVRDLLVQLAHHLDEDLDQERHRATGRSDVCHEQDGVAGGLVHLHAEPIHQMHAFERVAVDPGRPDGQGDTARIEDEVVPVPRRHHVGQAGPEGLIDTCRPELTGDEVGGGQAAYVAAQQRVVVDRVAQAHGVLDLLLYQLESLEVRLPAAEVEGREDLVVGRGGRVCHVGLVEGVLDLLGVVLVEDVDHPALAQ